MDDYPQTAFCVVLSTLVSTGFLLETLNIVGCQARVCGVTTCIIAAVVLIALYKFPSKNSIGIGFLSGVLSPFLSLLKCVFM